MKIQKFTDADLHNLLPHLNQSQNHQLSAPNCASAEATNFIPNKHNANHSNQPQQALSQFHCFTRLLLDDFQFFETAMPPPTPSPSSQRDPFPTASTACSISLDHNCQLATEIQDCLVMIEEMAPHDHPGGSSLFLGGNSAAKTLKMDFEACPEHAAESYGRAAGHSIKQNGVYFQGAPNGTSFACYSVRYFLCSQNNTGKAKRTHCRMRYKGVVESEEETARRMELTKIKNREAAAQAHLRKQYHNAHWQTLLLKLRKKNKFLQKKLMFLQGHKRINVHPQALRRSISGPI